jgi:hypothetical protein
MAGITLFPLDRQGLRSDKFETPRFSAGKRYVISVLRSTGSLPVFWT